MEILFLVLVDSFVSSQTLVMTLPGHGGMDLRHSGLLVLEKHLSCSNTSGSFFQGLNVEELHF